MAFYYVEDNNWTADVSNVINKYNTSGSNFDGIYYYPLTNAGDGAVNDPAYKCEKKFTASYVCGTEAPKTLLVDNAGYEENGMGNGKTIPFNCSATYKQCKNIFLVLGNDGSLRIETRDPSINVLWTNRRDASLIGLAAKALATSDPIESSGKVRYLHSTNNYLVSGEFLGLDEYIISTNKKFRLVLDDSNGTAELKVIYVTSGCRPKNNDIILDGSAAKLYHLTSNRTDIGQLGYVDELGVLHNYPDEMTTYSSDYKNIGNYGLSGTDLKTQQTVDDVEKCKELCSDHNMIDLNNSNNSDISKEKCVGFVYDKIGKVCHMRDKSIYNNAGNRFMNENYEYYMRTKKGNASKIDPSCPIDVEQIKTDTNEVWNSFTSSSKKSSDVMTKDYKCGLGKFTENETKAVQMANEALGKEFVGKFIEFKDGLMTKYNSIKDSIKAQSGLITTKLNDLQESRRELGDWTGEQLKQLNAMNEDRDLNRISQNYKHILWSILAIIIIIGAIRITRSVSKTPAKTIGQTIAEKMD